MCPWVTLQKDALLKDAYWDKLREVLRTSPYFGFLPMSARVTCPNKQLGCVALVAGL